MMNSIHKEMPYFLWTFWW